MPAGAPFAGDRGNCEPRSEGQGQILGPRQSERRCGLGDGSHRERCSFILVFAVGATERQQTQSFAVPLVQQRLKNFILKVQSSCGSLSDFPLLHSTSDAAIFLCYLKNNIGYHSWASCPFHALLLSKKPMPHL